jgi:IclR family acetate operon transcriptional repressor
MTSRTADEPVFGAQTITRALSLLNLLRQSPTDLGVTEIARALSLNTTTVHRTLRALVSEGYVAQSPDTDRYRLGREAFLLGLAAERTLGLAAVAPLLERLRDETGESANLVVRDGDSGLVVVRVESHHPLRFSQPVGTRIPLHCTSSGKVLLAFAPDPEAEVAGLGELDRLTSSTITSPQALLRELEGIANRGYSVNRAERIAGVVGVAAPVLAPGGQVVAAVAAQGPQVRLPEGRLGELGDLVRANAALVAEALPRGYLI